MAIYTFVKTGSDITINTHQVIQASSYYLQRMTESVLYVSGDNFAIDVNIDTTVDEITVNGVLFSGNAEELKTLLYATIFPTAPATTFKSYVALLNQTGTADPVATVLNSGCSDYLGNIVWTRGAQGLYWGTLTGAFPIGKTYLSITQSNNNHNGVAYFNQLNTNQIFINTCDSDNNTTDEDLIDRCIKVEVYP